MIYDVTDFGATGDGVTDDTFSIQTALETASASGGVVFAPAGKYLIANGGLVIPSGVSLKGENLFAAWFYPGKGTRFVCRATAALPIITVPQGTPYFAIEGIAFSTVSGTTDQPCIQVNGASGSGNSCGNAVIRNVEASSVGGLDLNYCNRIRLENVILQTWYGQYGFKFNHCSIVHMEWCSSAPAGRGTDPSSPWSAHYYLNGSGSLIMLNCGGAGQPYYGMDLHDATSLALYDFENNGAVQAVVHITGSGGDINFHRIYNNGPQCVNGIQVDGPCNMGSIQVIGGTIGNFSGSALSCTPSSGFVARCIFSNVYLGNSQAAPYFSFSGPTWSWVISNNIITGTQPSPQMILDKSSQPQRRMVFSGNVCELTQGPPSISVTSPVYQGYGWAVTGNQGV